MAWIRFTALTVPYVNMRSNNTAIHAAQMSLVSLVSLWGRTQCSATATEDGAEHQPAHKRKMYIMLYVHTCVRAQVTAHVSDALSKGAKVLAGGKVPELPAPLSNGHFYSPTVLADATIDM
jgi:hypothetical protein